MGLRPTEGYENPQCRRFMMMPVVERRDRWGSEAGEIEGLSDPGRAYVPISASNA